MRWTDVEDIAEALEELHPDTDVANIRFTVLRQLVLELLDFEDQHVRSSERVLEAIQAAWLELRGEEQER